MSAATKRGDEDSPDVVACETFAHADAFLDALAPRDARWGGDPGAWCFRGHGDARWQLLPNALRADVVLDYGPLVGESVSRVTLRDRTGPRRTYRGQVAAEYGLLRAFLDAANEQGYALPAAAEELWAGDAALAAAYAEAERGTAVWPVPRLTPLLALAQHYGVPTRLLDWSRDARVAAYFAVEHAAREMVGRLATRRRRPTHGEHLDVWALDQHAVVALGQRAAGRTAREVRFVHTLGASNPNLHAQRGLFSVVTRPMASPHAWPDVEPLDAVLGQFATFARAHDAFDHRDAPTGYAPAAAPRPVLRRLTLPYAQAPRLLRLLAIEGVTAQTVWPGLAGVARALAERRLWDVSPRDAYPAGSRRGA